MDDYKEYEKKCKEIHKENDQWLAIFKKELKEAGLSDKTIRNHISNADLFINEYLLREDAYPMEYGIRSIDDFIGYFFIRKCAWSTPSSIQSTAASLKKFYQCMVRHGRISIADYEILNDTIKENIDDWKEDCETYNNGGDYLEDWF